MKLKKGHTNPKEIKVVAVTKNLPKFLSMINEIGFKQKYFCVIVGKEKENYRYKLTVKEKLNLNQICKERVDMIDLKIEIFKKSMNIYIDDLEKVRKKVLKKSAFVETLAEDSKTETEPEVKETLEEDSEAETEPEVKETLEEDSEAETEPEVEETLEEDSETETEPEVEETLEEDSEAETEPEVKETLKEDSEAETEPVIEDTMEGKLETKPTEVVEHETKVITASAVREYCLTLEEFTIPQINEYFQASNKLEKKRIRNAIDHGKEKFWNRIGEKENYKYVVIKQENKETKKTKPLDLKKQDEEKSMASIVREYCLTQDEFSFQQVFDYLKISDGVKKKCIRAAIYAGVKRNLWYRTESGNFTTRKQEERKECKEEQEEQEQKEDP